MFNHNSLTIAVFNLVAGALPVAEDADPKQNKPTPEALIAGTDTDSQTAAVILDALMLANAGERPMLRFQQGETYSRSNWLAWEQADKEDHGPARLARIQLYDLMDQMQILPVHPEDKTQQTTAAETVVAQSPAI